MEYGNDFDFSYGVPDGPTMSSSGSDIFSVIMTVYLLVIVAAVMIGIVKYVFKSIALYRLAQRTGNANPWMAWVPFARSYLQGDLAGSMPLKKRRLQSPGLWKVLIPLIGTAVIAGLYFLFIVVAGHGLIQERNINTGEKVEFEVSGDKIEAIHMIPGWTHNIINLSETENLVTVMTCNEIFNPERPDTFFEEV